MSLKKENSVSSLFKERVVNHNCRMLTEEASARAENDVTEGISEEIKETCANRKRNPYADFANLLKQRKAA